MVKLVCIVEVEEATTIEQAQEKLDAFREATQPAHEYGLTIYRASEAEADAAFYDVSFGDVFDAERDTPTNHDADDDEDKRGGSTH